jgi:hypothetical protein
MAQSDNDSDNCPSVKAPDATRTCEDDDDDAPLVTAPQKPRTYQLQSDVVDVPARKQPAAADLLDFDSPPPKVP